MLPLNPDPNTIPLADKIEGSLCIVVFNPALPENVPLIIGEDRKYDEVVVIPVIDSLINDILTLDVSVLPVTNENEFHPIFK
jgi:hypothetical protein